MIKLKAINRSIFIITIIVYLIAVLIYGFLDYSNRKSEIIENIDKELYNSAVALKYILPDDYHDRAVDDQAVSLKEDKYISYKLTKFIKESGIKYTYSVVKKGGTLLFVASDLQVLPKTTRGTFYFYPYEEADESFVKAFDQEKPTYRTVLDKWGKVRTVIVPEMSPGGIKYLSCADYDISYVDGVLRSNLLRSVASVLFFLLLSIPIIIFYIRIHREYWGTIQKSEKRYRTLFEKSTDAIFIVERSTGRYLDANEAAIRLCGRKLSELKNLTTQDTTPDKFRERLNIIEKGITTADLGKVTYIRPDGSQRVAILTSVPIDNEAVIGIARDLTDELDMEHQLRQAQKMEAIGTLAGGIAHDFNNILSAILGYSELALAELPPEASLRNKLEAIHSSGERARDLVTQILAFSRKDEQIRSMVELHLILEDTLKLLRPAIPTTIDIQTQISSNCRVLGDPSRIHQVIMNLCTNAYQAMLEAGGTLTISLSEVKMEGRAAAITQLPSGSYCKLVISDTGVGIPSNNLERIFDPYFTTKEKGKGTGLGLAAVHGIVKSHGGAILVESQIMQGTSFQVYFPLTWEKSFIEEQDEAQIAGGNERILIVDDEPDILEIERENLEMLGYKITTKSEPQEALSLFAKGPEHFDLVITDMTMSGLTGEKLSSELLKIRLDIPIILCTGYSSLMSQEKAYSMGIKGFLMKPVKLRELSEMIRNVLDTVNHLP